MAGLREQKKAMMRDKMLASVRKRISTSGVHSIRARDVAADCDCAVGVIYNIFQDLEDLILTVSGEYFADLDELLALQSEYLVRESGEDHMIRLARVYYEYARDNPREWGAVFYFRVDQAHSVPEWHGEYMPRLLDYLAKPIAKISPDTSKSDLNLWARTMFSAMHGLCALSLKGYRSGVNEKEMPIAIDLLVRGFCRQVTAGQALRQDA